MTARQFNHLIDMKTLNTRDSFKLIPGQTHRLLCFLIPLLLLTPGLTGRAQILQQWTNSAAIGEASAAIALDGGCMIVADNEDEILRVYPRFSSVASGAPVYSFNVRPDLALSSSNPEADLEAGLRVDGPSGTRLYWVGSHSNSKSGNYRPNRLRLFATSVTGNGTGAIPYSMSYIGRYDRLRDDLIAWDRDNLHGLGPHYLGLAASAALGVIPTRIDGFNIEGLVLAPDGVTAYIAFRTPLVNGSGATTDPSQRTNALLVPLLNLPDLVTGNPTAGPTTARFGSPITLNLGGRGVRSIDSSSPGQYVITAGPTDVVSNPPVAPYNFCLFTWSGDPVEAPIEHLTQFPYGYEPEGAIVAPGPITRATEVQFVSDDSGGWFRSFTTQVGPAAGPSLTVSVSGGYIQVSWPANTVGYRLQYCMDLTRDAWIDSTLTPSGYGTPRWTVSEPIDGMRYYRLYKPRN